MDRDPQQSRVYELEDEFIAGWMRHTPSMSQPQLQAYADAVCKHYRVPLVTVMLPRRPHSYLGQYFESEDDEPSLIKLYVKKRSRCSSRNLPVLLHELAHHVDTCRRGGTQEHHGPRFVHILADMYDRYKIIDRPTFVARAKKRGVRVAPKKRKPA